MEYLEKREKGIKKLLRKAFCLLCYREDNALLLLYGNLLSFFITMNDEIIRIAQTTLNPMENNLCLCAFPQFHYFRRVAEILVAKIYAVRNRQFCCYYDSKYLRKRFSGIIVDNQVCCLVPLCKFANANFVYKSYKHEQQTSQTFWLLLICGVFEIWIRLARKCHFGKCLHWINTKNMHQTSIKSSRLDAGAI